MNINNENVKVKKITVQGNKFKLILQDFSVISSDIIKISYHTPKNLLGKENALENTEYQTLFNKFNI